jgi:hypothetical protein
MCRVTTSAWYLLIHQPPITGIGEVHSDADFPTNPSSQAPKFVYYCLLLFGGFIMRSSDHHKPL